MALTLHGLRDDYAQALRTHAPDLNLQVSVSDDATFICSPTTLVTLLKKLAATSGWHSCALYDHGMTPPPIGEWEEDFLVVEEVDNPQVVITPIPATADGVLLSTKGTHTKCTRDRTLPFGWYVGTVLAGVLVLFVVVLYRKMNGYPYPKGYGAG